MCIVATIFWSNYMIFVFNVKGLCDPGVPNKATAIPQKVGKMGEIGVAVGNGNGNSGHILLLNIRGLCAPGVPNGVTTIPWEYAKCLSLNSKYEWQHWHSFSLGVCVPQASRIELLPYLEGMQNTCRWTGNTSDNSGTTLVGMLFIVKFESWAHSINTFIRRNYFCFFVSCLAFLEMIREYLGSIFIFIAAQGSPICLHTFL